jgi:pimeloyl-ACP methyl ester carboxylesterase
MRRAAAALAALLLAGCSLEQTLLFRSRPADPERFAAILRSDPGVEEVRITAADGVKLHGLLKRAPAAAPGQRYPLVIVFGGVARETSWMVSWGDKPPAWGWLMVNYRGYGLSEGRPSEEALLEDTALVYDWAAARPDIDRNNIVVLGRSLGSFFAVALAARRPVRAAILATPFDSLTAVGAERYPLLPIGMLVNGRYDTIALLPKVKIPALFVLADSDDVVPIQHGKALAQAWNGPKRLLTLPGGHRMIERRREYWRAIGAFLGELRVAGRSQASTGSFSSQLPAIVMLSTRIEPQRCAPRTTTSRPAATMPRNMSLRLPATVTSSTGKAISPLSTQ